MDFDSLDGMYMPQKSCYRCSATKSGKTDKFMDNKDEIIELLKKELGKENIELSLGKKSFYNNEVESICYTVYEENIILGVIEFIIHDCSWHYVENEELKYNDDNIEVNELDVNLLEKNCEEDNKQDLPYGIYIDSIQKPTLEWCEVNIPKIKVSSLDDIRKSIVANRTPIIGILTDNTFTHENLLDKIENTYFDILHSNNNIYYISEFWKNETECVIVKNNITYYGVTSLSIVYNRYINSNNIHSLIPVPKGDSEEYGEAYLLVFYYGNIGFEIMSVKFLPSDTSESFLIMHSEGMIYDFNPRIFSVKYNEDINSDLIFIDVLLEVSGPKVFDINKWTLDEIYNNTKFLPNVLRCNCYYYIDSISLDKIKDNIYTPYSIKSILDKLQNNNLLLTDEEALGKWFSKYRNNDLLPFGKWYKINITNRFNDEESYNMYL